MMPVDKAFALALEGCFKQTHISITETYSQGKMLAIHDGMACFSGFDSYFSQVVGWGLSTQLKHLPKELALIESFYRSLAKTQIDIELCSFVPAEIPHFLGQQGYLLDEIQQVFHIDLADNSFSLGKIEPFMLRPINSEEHSLWAKVAADAFGVAVAEAHFYHCSQAKGAVPFAAFYAGKMIAVALLMIHEIGTELGMACTLPAFRNKGLQKKLLLARLEYAKHMQASWAMVAATPGSVSAVNVQKAGFKPVYDRFKFSLDNGNYGDS